MVKQPDNVQSGGPVFALSGSSHFSRQGSVLQMEAAGFCHTLAKLAASRRYERLVIFLLAWLLTPWSRVLLDKLTGFPAFYGTRRFITALTSAHHPSLSWVSSIQLIPPYPTSWRSILIILPPTPGSSKWSLYLRFPNQNPVNISPLPHT